MDTFFYIEAQKRSRVTKLGAQTQHRVVLRLVPPSASKQSEKMCARDKRVVFHNIGKAISGSTVVPFFVMCIHVYPFVARNHGGIPFSGVCPIVKVMYGWDLIRYLYG